MPAYKDEKRGTWYVKFRYTDWTGKRIETMKRGFATKREAKAYEESARKDRTAAEGMTFGELYEIYIEDMRHRLRASSIQTKTKICKLNILPYFSGLAIDKITPAVIRKWQTEIIRRGLANTYMKTIQAHFSAIFNYAVKYYNLPRNPVPIAGAIGKATAMEMDYWTMEEFRKFISHENKPMYRALFLTLFWCGIRCGELLALTGEDVDAGAGTIRINKTYTRLKGRQDSITPPKTPGSTRKISAPSVVIDAILEYIKTMYGYEPTERIFNIHPRSIRRRMDSICEIVGIKKIRIHDLRHSHASYLINNNVPIKLIASRLGHDNAETTLRTYAHMYKETAATVADMMEMDSKK